MTPAIQPPKDDYLKRLRAGNPVEFVAPPTDHDESPEEKEARTIPARWLETLADNHKRAVTLPIYVSNAIIAGDLNLEYAVFECNFSITNCEFTGVVNCSFAEFCRAASLRRCKFLRQSFFRAVHAHFDFDIAETSFDEISRFQDLRCDEVLGAVATRFAEADFQRIKIRKDAFFTAADAGRQVKFGGWARFDGAQIGGDANFCGAEFRHDAMFYNLQVGGNALFQTANKDQRVTFWGKVNFNSAKISGSADFSGSDFRDSAWFDAAQFKGPVFFQANQQVATFADLASFPSAAFDLDARFFGVGFGRADFENARFGAPARFDSARFAGEANFASCSFGDNAFFRASHFERDVHFNGAQISGDASFSGAEFKGSAAFDGLRVDGAAFFRTNAPGQRTRFGGQTRFHGARIAGNLEFDGAQFLGVANFNGVQVANDAFFRTDPYGNQLTFAEDANFLNMRVAGAAEFNGTRFEKNAVFEGIDVGNNAYFRPDGQNRPAQFGGAARFLFATFGSGAQFRFTRFESDAAFDNASFKGLAEFSWAEFQERKKASFKGARFERGANLDLIEFRGETDFTAAISERDVHFTGSRFGGRLSLQEAHLHSIFFGEPANEKRESWWPRPFQWKERTLSKSTTWAGPIDLYGLTYERINVFLPDLLKRIDPFYRQPYSQLEATLRAMGDDQRARIVYLERRRRERKHKYDTGRRYVWLLDWIYKVVANYGVAPFRLILFALAFIFLGAFIFKQPGALDPARNEPNRPSTACVHASFGDGVAISVHYFLPMDVPIGDDCKPVPGRVLAHIPIAKHDFRFLFWPSPSWYAAIFLRVAGAVLMGIGLAAVTGILRRIAQ